MHPELEIIFDRNTGFHEKEKEKKEKENGAACNRKNTVIYSKKL